MKIREKQEEKAVGMDFSDLATDQKKSGIFSFFIKYIIICIPTLSAKSHLKLYNNFLYGFTLLLGIVAARFNLFYVFMIILVDVIFSGFFFSFFF